VMEQSPHAWGFFIVFILIATFTMLNLFIAIIVNAMQSFSDEEHRETASVVDQAREHIEADLHNEIRELRSEIVELKTLLTRPRE
jgi:voltage-gated sodium channel